MWLLSHGNAMLRVSLKPIYKSIPSTHVPCMERANICSLGSRRREWRCTMTTCWRNKSVRCFSQLSNMGIVSRTSRQACEMITLSGCGNYTLLRIWDGMTYTNALPDTGVDTSSEATDGWCGSQPMPSISFTPLSIAVTVIYLRNTPMMKCPLQTVCKRQRKGEMPEDNNVLVIVKPILGVGDALVHVIIMSNGAHLWNFACEIQE